MRILTLLCIAGMISWASSAHAQPPAGLYPAVPNIERLPPIVGPGLPSSDVGTLPNPTTPATPVTHQLPLDAPEPEAVEAPVEEVIEEGPESPWSGSFELGLNGSDGNNDIFNFRLGLDLERKTDWTKFTFDLDYKNDSTDEVQTANRLFIDGRQEWKRKEGPWSIFAHGTTEYDEFQDFDTRIAADAGLTYEFIKTDIGRFAGRMGLGGSREIGGSDDDWTPEASLGLDAERKLSKWQKFVMSVDYFPSLSDFGDSRIQLKADWEITIDADMNLAVKFGVLDRYDSTPGDAEHNDLDYSAVVLWKF